MKINTLIFFLAFACFANAQKQLPLVDGKVTFTGVEEVKGQTADNLYVNAKSWAEKNYKGGGNAIVKDDKATGELSVKGMFKLYKDGNLSKYEGSVYYVLTISVKEGKYKYSITDMSHKNHDAKESSGGKLEREEPLCGTKEMPIKKWQEIKDKAYDNSMVLIEEVKKNMTIQGAKNSSDW